VLICLAADASDNAARRAEAFAHAPAVPIARLPYEKQTISDLVGKTGCSMLAVTDIGFAAAFAAALADGDEASDRTLADALKVPTERMQRAAKAPGNSFEDQVESLNGTVPYIYYAYYPDQYHDGVNWLQMTIVFPMEGYWDGYGILSGTEETRGPDTYSDHSADYEGYDSDDDFVHYEVFLTATPEPDSAASELDHFR
jgi:hypothetical protein